MMNMRTCGQMEEDQVGYRNSTWNMRVVGTPYRKLLPYFSLLLILSGVLAGCGGSDDSSTSNTSVPTAPRTSAFNVVTENYYYHYKEGTGSTPFSAENQFSDGNYPIPVAFSSSVSNPQGFDLAEDTKQSFICWAKGDPRICAVGGVPSANARIRIVLEKSINYDGESDVVGLTTVQNTNKPSFTVEVATSYLRSGGNPNNVSDYIALSTDDVAKILVHEIGHTLGLGHSPDRRDLMYYQINASQGVGYGAYLTYGDAMALWSTLNARGISWDSSRPPYSTIKTDGKSLVRNETPITRGQIVCIFHKTDL